MGYDFVFQQCAGAGWLLLSMLISMESPLQILILEFYIFIIILSIVPLMLMDHGLRRGDTGWILIRWRHPVASRVALDLPYWAMHSAPYRLIRMTIEMAREAGPFFSVIDFMSCIRYGASLGGPICNTSKT